MVEHVLLLVESYTPMTNPTQALAAIEQALREAHDELCLLARHRRIELPQVDKNMIDALAHLATLRQQVADLVAFREAHEWQPIETAPKESGFGSMHYILARFYDWQDYEDGPVYKKMAWCHTGTHFSSQGWYLGLRGVNNLAGGAAWLPLESPTHYRLIPTPPAAEGG